MKKVKLDLKGLSQDRKARAKEIAGDILVQEINSFLDSAKTPVSKGSFRGRKKDGTAADLFEFGDMRIAIDSRPNETDHVSVGIFEDADQLQRDKALGHNTGFKGHPNERKLKKYKREFIPAPNKKFKQSIMKKVNENIDILKAEQDQENELAAEILNDLGEFDF